MKRIFQIPELGVAVLIIVISLVCNLVNPMFLSGANILTILRGSAFYGIVAIGIALCLISGTIDLSIGAIAGLSATVFSLLVNKWGINDTVSIFVGLVIGGLCGLLNGFISVKLKITPFMTTIGMMYILRGIANYLTGGLSIYPLSDTLKAFGEAQPLGLSWTFIIFIVLAVMANIILFGTIYGLKIRATGSDREVARCTEVDPDKIQISVFIITGVLSALAGILLACRINAGQATIGLGWELPVISACVIGGVSLFGYEGSIFGAVLGIIAIQVIQNAVVAAGISAYLQIVAVGIVLIMTMILDVRRRMKFNLDIGLRN